jgi:hypothetical protein
VALIKDGWWQDTWWPSRWWQEDYWLEYGTAVAPAPVVREGYYVRRARPKRLLLPFSFETLTLIRQYLELKQDA